MHAVLAIIIALSHVPHGHHYGWQQPRNPHYRPPVVVVTRPPVDTTCTWVILNQLGSPPRLVCVHVMTRAPLSLNRRVAESADR